MKKKLTITEVEKRIADLEALLSQPLPMATWSLLVGNYNALKIKRCQMNGESPSVDYSKPEYII
ncbi:hypothetical protein [Dysgonomonas sp. Marseille-P4361]|uniref:hypothetical protein n=1 Tax=Dysgonomonas sp. Marseille-P4361 TaxID=2161820 RepID=UPI000D54E96E|nr:hypothetical protein [Dysgonomonas sp. Marseille-P4361]